MLRPSAIIIVFSYIIFGSLAYAGPVNFHEINAKQQSIAGQILLKRGEFLKGRVDGQFGKQSQRALDEFRVSTGQQKAIGAPISARDLGFLARRFGDVDESEILSIAPNSASTCSDFREGKRVRYTRSKYTADRYGTVVFPAGDGKMLVDVDGVRDHRSTTITKFSKKRVKISCSKLSGTRN